MGLTHFVLGLLLGGIISAFYTMRYYRNIYKHLLQLGSGVTFENRILVQALLALFPNNHNEINISVKQRHFRVFQEHGDIKYIEIPSNGGHKCNT